jgi:hypothetical protein
MGKTARVNPMYSAVLSESGGQGMTAYGSLSLLARNLNLNVNFNLNQ